MHTANEHIKCYWINITLQHFLICRVHMLQVLMQTWRRIKEKLWKENKNYLHVCFSTIYGVIAILSRHLLLPTWFVCIALYKSSNSSFSTYLGFFFSLLFFSLHATFLLPTVLLQHFNFCIFKRRKLNSHFSFLGGMRRGVALVYRIIPLSGRFPTLLFIVSF